MKPDMNPNPYVVAGASGHPTAASTPSRRKPYVAPCIREQGTLAIHAGSINLWLKKP